MTATLDANVLLYASDEDSRLHERALDVIEESVEGPELLYLFWPVLTAYLRLSTHPSVFARPLAVEQAIGNVNDLLTRPRVRSPGEDADFWTVYRSTLGEGDVHGNLVTDAHIVGLMRQYRVRTIFTRDRDFRRFDGLRALDPFG